MKEISDPNFHTGLKVFSKVSSSQSFGSSSWKLNETFFGFIIGKALENMNSSFYWSFIITRDRSVVRSTSADEKAGSDSVIKEASVNAASVPSPT